MSLSGLGRMNLTDIFFCEARREAWVGFRHAVVFGWPFRAHFDLGFRGGAVLNCFPFGAHFDSVVSDDDVCGDSLHCQGWQYMVIGSKEEVWLFLRLDSAPVDS
jgi:hypothetical protein